MMVRRINLVPPSERQRTQTDLGLLLLVVSTLILAGAMAFSYVFYSSERSDKQRELADLQAQTRRVRTQLASLAHFEALQQTRVATETLVQQIYANRTLLSQVLGDLSLVVPDNAWFSSLSLSSPAPVAAPGGKTAAAGSPAGTMSIQGSTYTFEDVARLLVRLEQIPSVSSAKLASAREVTAPSGKTVCSFSVSMSVVNNQPPSIPLPLSRVEVASR